MAEIDSSKLIFVVPVEGMNGAARLVLADAIAASLRDARKPAILTEKANAIGPTIAGRIVKVEERDSVVWVTVVWELRAPYGTVIAEYRQQIVTDSRLWMSGSVEAINLLVFDAGPKIVAMVHDYVGPATLAQGDQTPPPGAPPPEKAAPGQSKSRKVAALTSRAPRTLDRKPVKGAEKKAPKKAPKKAKKVKTKNKQKAKKTCTPMVLKKNPATTETQAQTAAQIPGQGKARASAGSRPRAGAHHRQSAARNLEAAGVPDPAGPGRPRRRQRGPDRGDEEGPSKKGHDRHRGPPPSGIRHPGPGRDQRPRWRPPIGENRLGRQHHDRRGSRQGGTGERSQGWEPQRPLERIAKIVSNAAVVGIQELFGIESRQFSRRSELPKFSGGLDLPQVPGRAPPPPK